MVLLSSARAQLVRVEAGASDLLPSEGGSINFQGANFTGYLGAGDLNGSFGLGGYLKTTFHSDVITLGDQPINLSLPTDLFATNHVYPTRGLGIARHQGNVNLFLFAGGTTLVSGTSFFQSARAELPAGMLFVDFPISGKLHFYSKGVVSRKRTSLQSLDWRPAKWLQSAISAGTGSNHGYLAASADAENRWLSLKTEYVAASDRFRRISAASVFASEVDRENVVAAIKPSASILITAGHQNLLQPQSLDPTAPFLRATVNSAQTSADVHEFLLGVGIFQSTYRGQSSLADNLSVSRKITQTIEIGVNRFQSITGSGSRVNNFSTSIRETISPRLSLLQIVNYSQGRTTVLYGGNYLSNRISIGVDYQTLYLPFRSNPFSQGVNISLRLRLPGSLQVNAQTFRSASGQLKYTAAADTLLTGNLRPVENQGEKAFKHLRYVVRGRVVDQKGEPVDGAAVLIGEELVFTNTAGEFFLRRKTAGVQTLEIKFAEFLNPASFRLVSAPQKVVPANDSAATEVIVVLERN